MIQIDEQLTPKLLQPACKSLWQLAEQKLPRIAAAFPPGEPTPVITRAGKYTAQGWTEWTQGFQYGGCILTFEATGNEELLGMAYRGVWEAMPAHVTHFGVHDHGFNNVSTYGNLRRLMLEGKIPRDQAQLHAYEIALKASAAVQAMRWSPTHQHNQAGGGFIYSFNGPHSLFSDTIRSLRVLSLGHQLGHRVLSENDEAVDLLGRLIAHARATAEWNVYYGGDSENQKRDAYDLRGRVVHESIINPNDGRYRCPSTQQGYSPFTTWTRGLAWVMLGFAEQLEFLDTLTDEVLTQHGGRETIVDMMRTAAEATCDFYIEQTPTDGIPYWDTGAPGLVKLGDYRDRPAEPVNEHEPVDSSAAAIACQGLMRLGRWLSGQGETASGARYYQAGLSVLRTLLGEPYLATDEAHDGLLLHSIYHRPRDWDYIPEGSAIPYGESSMWGDYHLLEAALYVERLAEGEQYYTFFNGKA
ncbi:glycoside hydrolase family 88 protein [Adhaeretor mobilis]|uniref:Unsaturated glucuronyl hydrolase n=1 Tax=Adhaeretor mobilis TaxID=1930276 RepID=A0A517N2L6_9BACT|nr:glycoside hydrolase family 88 protein [Adhaeretor mobilis]QDT01238.1 Unsaturated glucuronyl hydrolase [Adhaeretor mobilis]